MRKYRNHRKHRKLAAAVGLAAAVTLSACGGGGNSAKEEIALGYVDGYVNAESSEEKSEYIEENVHADAQPLLQMGAQMSGETSSFENAEAVDSTEVEEDGETSTAVLLEGEQNGEATEMVVIVYEEKAGIGFAEGNDGFSDMRSNFE